MTFTETTPSALEADTHHPTTSLPTTLNLQVPGLEIRQSEPVVLEFGVLKNLVQCAEAVSSLATGVNWSIRHIELIDGFALFHFDPPKVGDLFSSRWSEAELVGELRRRIAEISKKISDTTSAGQSGKNPNADSGQDGVGQRCGELAVCKLTKAGVKVVFEPSPEAESVKLPAKEDLPRPSRRDPTGGETTITIEAITRDRKTAYDNSYRPVKISGVQAARPLQVGDQLKGCFVPVPGSAKAALVPLEGTEFVCRSADGDEFTIGPGQKSLPRI